jgi:protein-S-isoprenylcysteine O-methyltransferase Ste14
MYLLLNLVLVIIVGLLPAVVLCALAGRWDLWNVWVTAGIFAALAAFQSLVLYRQSPAILKERTTLGTGGRVRWTVGLVFVVVNIVQWIISGLDQRFHWSNSVPPAGVVAGIVLFAIGWGLFTWSALVNPFFSPEVRLQAERGQRVIHEGPYAIVRHPGYATNLLTVVATGLALNSLVALLPAVVFAAVVVRVTAFEDRMLHEELAGYATYAAKVRFRLMPGVW